MFIKWVSLEAACPLVEQVVHINHTCHGWHNAFCYRWHYFYDECTLEWRKFISIISSLVHLHLLLHQILISHNFLTLVISPNFYSLHLSPSASVSPSTSFPFILSSIFFSQLYSLKSFPPSCLSVSTFRIEVAVSLWCYFHTFTKKGSYSRLFIIMIL